MEEDHENHEMPRSGSSYPRLPQKSALSASLKETWLILEA